LRRQQMCGSLLISELCVPRSLYMHCMRHGNYRFGLNVTFLHMYVYT